MDIERIFFIAVLALMGIGYVVHKMREAHRTFQRIVRESMSGEQVGHEN